MLRNRWVAGVVAGAALALLAACGGPDPSGGETSGQRLTIWTLTQEDSQSEAWAALVAEFENRNPGVEVVTEERATDPHKDALRQAAGTGSGPDLYRYWGGAGLGGELVRVGLSSDLAEYYDQYDWEAQMSPAALANATQYGGYHGVPFIQATEAVFYNRELFEQAGIDSLPQTYDELLAAADALAATGVAPMAFGGTVNWHVMRLLDSLLETTCGADVADDLTQGDGDWSAQSCVDDAFTELATWGDQYLNTGFMAMSNDDSSQLFFSGQAAMTIEGDWFGPMAIDGGLPPENLGIFPFPTGTGRAYGFGELMYLTPDSPHADLAASFLDFMLSVDGQELLGTAFSAISVNPDVEPADDAPLAAEWAELIGAAQGSYVNNDQNFAAAETAEYWRVQNSVLTGDLAPADAGAEFQRWRDANS